MAKGPPNALERLRGICLDWDEIAELCEDAYRAVAPKRLVALLETGRNGP